MLDGAHPVYRVAPGVVDPPKPISTPDPECPESGRLKRQENTSRASMIVDENGDPALISLNIETKPTFDTMSVAAISRWKFKPATLNGKPVAVLISVEINFRLY